MKVSVRVFPIEGMCSQSQDLDMTLEEGSFGEVLTFLQMRFDVTMDKLESLMFLHNGYGLDRRKNVVFHDGDQLWLLPLLSGG